MTKASPQRLKELEEPPRKPLGDFLSTSSLRGLLCHSVMQSGFQKMAKQFPNIPKTDAWQL
jgi:hypothetical protein